MSAIAEFYASMSFKVDSSGLTAFRNEMQVVQKEMANTLAILHATSKALKNTLKDFGTLQHKFDAKSMQSWRKSIAAAARAYIKVVEASNGVLHQVAQEASKSQIKLSNFEKRLNSNIVALNSYAHALMPVVLLLERLRGAAGSPLPRVGGGFRGGANGAGGAGQGGHGGAGRPPSGAGAGLLETAGIMAFLKPMLPMGMGLGGMLGGGYAFRELIGAGREMFAMELKMKAVSKSSEAFANNMKYVRELSQQLGLDLVGAGNAYAQIVVTAQEKMNPEQMQKMFTGFNKYYATVHMTAEDQRLANLAIQQMFGKDKIQAQEARLQMGQRVTPFIKLLTEAAKEKMGAKFTTFDDVMKKGLLDPAELLPIVADKLTEIANTGGALTDALKNSQVAQIRFNNSLKEFSYIVMKGGLDHALAVMFSLGSEIIPAIATGFKSLIHLVKSLGTFLKAAFDVVQEHPFISGGIAIFLGMALAINAMNKNMFLFLNRLADVLLAVKSLNVALLVSAARTAAMVAGLTAVVYLFSELEGYFNGEENNVLMVWYHGVQLLISEFDLMFAKIKLGWAEVRNGINPFADYNAQGMDTGNRSINIPVISPLIDSMIKNMINPASDFIRDGVGLKPQSQNHWWSSPSNMNNPQGSIINNINIDISKAPINVQRAIENGDMSAMGNYLAQEIQSSYGGVGSYAS